MNKKFLYSPLSIKSIGENVVFSGYASVFNIVDKQNDLIQLQKEQKQVEDQLKAEIKELQEEKRNRLAEVDSLKVNLSIVAEQLKQQLLLNNQEQQRMGKELKDVDKRLEDIDGETKKSQGQTKTKTPNAVSLVSTVSAVKSTTGSGQ